MRIGTLPNSFTPSDRPGRLGDGASAAAAVSSRASDADNDSLLSDNSKPPALSEAEGSLSDSDSLLSDSDLMTILRKEENAASNYQWSALSQTREDALNYYDREPYGDEQEGASQVVTSEFSDVIESIMPGLMRVFTSTDDVAEFTPGAPGEEQWAKEASEYVPHVFMRQNDGFRILYWMIKDALMYRLGAVTVDLEDYSEKRRVPVQGLPQDAIDLVVAQAAEEGAELAMELEQDEARLEVPGAPLPSRGEGPFPPPPAPSFSGSITITRKRQRVVADNIAPEDILFTPTARDQDKASFLGFRKRVTASDLVEMGLSPDEVDELGSDRDLSPEDTQRNDGASLNEAERSDLGDSERPLWLVVAYVRADNDGDGISELLRVVYAHAGGTAGRIVERVEWDGLASIALASPILMSHTIVGRSLFDQTQDLQEIGSVLTRGLLDNLYITNRPRPVISDQVNLDSLIDWVPGSPVRLKAGARPNDNHVSWLQVPNVSAGVLAALEYLATVRENRTGIVRNNQGLDADSLNKTASGMNMLMSAAQQRQELIARVLAETAIKRLYRLVYRAIKRACAGPVKYWSGRQFASCDPSRWPDEMELSVNVGLGTGSKDQAIQHLALIGTLQEKLIALQGGQADGPYVTPENVANAAQKVTETLGFKTPGMFFQPPDRIAAAVPPTGEPQPAPPPPDPAVALALAQIEIARQAAAADTEIKRLKAEADIEIAQWKARQWAEVERFKVGLKAELDEHELQHKHALRSSEGTALRGLGIATGKGGVPS
jgi:hypothetical protein